MRNIERVSRIWAIPLALSLGIGLVACKSGGESEQCIPGVLQAANVIGASKSGNVNVKNADDCAATVYDEATSSQIVGLIPSETAFEAKCLAYKPNSLQVITESGQVGTVNLGNEVTDQLLGSAIPDCSVPPRPTQSA